MGELINQSEIRKSIAMLCNPQYPFEVRIVRNGRKGGISGYFMDADTLLKQFDTVDLRNTNVYITLNTLKPELYSREQADHFRDGVKTTADKDVGGYQWLLIDLDPERASGISSSREELMQAYALSKTIKDYLHDRGWEDPLEALSGNGIHLLYKVQLLNNKEMSDTVENCLKVLDALFSNEAVAVDTTVFNPARVCKLYGTRAQKGRNTTERPHRMSRILTLPDTQIKVTKLAYLKDLAAELPEEPEAPQKYNRYHPKEFDIEAWMSEHGLRYTATKYKNGDKYVLDECPFDSSHKAPDASVFRTSSGAIGFKCLHNSCSCYKWKDLRLRFEPDAYSKTSDDDRIESGWQAHNRERNEPVAQDKGLMFETALDILNKPDPEQEFIPTGINKLDKAIRGLEKGKLSILTGLRGSAKSTLMSQLILTAVDHGQRCICYSGELSDKSFTNWIYLQAAGKHHVIESARFEGFYNTPTEVKKEIATWMSDKFLLYNNNYGHDWWKLYESIKVCVVESKADMVVIDNLMTLDLGNAMADKYDIQTKFIQSLKDLAMKCNVHVMLVAHPRKQEGLLRLDSVAGTGNLTNYVDTALIIHRVNEDFKINAKKTFGWKDDAVILSTRCSNALEIAKDRESGTNDYWVDLYFEKETKRLKNHASESILYGWDKPKFEGFHCANDIDF